MFWYIVISDSSFLLFFARALRAQNYRTSTGTAISSIRLFLHFTLLRKQERELPWKSCSHPSSSARIISQSDGRTLEPLLLSRKETVENTNEEDSVEELVDEDQGNHMIELESGDTSDCNRSTQNRLRHSGNPASIKLWQA
jgi:hypothetical protein